MDAVFENERLERSHWNCKWNCLNKTYNIIAGSDTIKVQYIDYGNTEEVKNENLVEIPQSIAAVKPLAQKLILHNCYANDLSDQNVSW